MKTAHDIIIRPVITEAAIEDMKDKKYTFEVASASNKIEIAKAVEDIFDVKVIKVTTITMKSKPRRVRYVTGKTSEWKKAIVRLSADSKTIPFFDSLM